MYQNITAPFGKGIQSIDKYGNGGFTVSKQRYEGSLIVFPMRVIAWEVRDAVNIVDDFFRLIKREKIFDAAQLPDVFLLGTGMEIQNANSELTEYMRERNVRLDIMNTGAACRTYNVLLAEERNIAAALFAVD